MNNNKKNRKNSDVKNKLFISQPMTGCDDNEIREYRKHVHRIVSIMFDDPDIELIEQFDVDESNVDFSGMNEAQIRMYRLNRSLSMLIDANIVVFAPNWWKSPGCIEEWIQCQLYTSSHVILGSAIETVDNRLYNAPITDDYDYDEESRIIETIDIVFKNIKRPSDGIIVEIPEIKLNTSLTSIKVLENTKALYNKTTPNDETDVNECVGFKVQGSINNDQTGTFESFINEWLAPDMDINEYMYSLMIHNKLIEIMTNAMKDRYGVGNTKITTYHERGALTYNATITFEPNDRNVKYTLSTKMGMYPIDNFEYVEASYSIDYCVKNYAGRKRDSVPFVVDYVSSQISPESDDYISNKCVVDYVGANRISSAERKLFGYINSELKSFINTRDDIFWVKKNK